MILVDTNVLLDVLEDDPEWADWSQANLDAATATDTLAINPIIYSELSIAFARIEELEAVIAEASLNMESIPREALFLAGKVFLSYRRARGIRRSVLPDFFVGAHAAVAHCPILTRDVARYRTYFPKVRLITP
jgi:predicted nucleic acid-binding protein